MVTCPMGAPDSPWAGLWAQAFFNGVAKAKPSKAKNKMSLNDQNVYFFKTNIEMHFDRRAVISSNFLVRASKKQKL